MTIPDTTRAWTLAAHPDGMVKTSDFSLTTLPLAAPGEGELTVRLRWLAFEPAMRGWITGQDTYVSGIQIGDVMRGMGVGEVIASRSEHHPVGALVSGSFGWREHATVKGSRGVRVVPDGIKPTLPLSALGMTGLTAYFGLLDIGRPQPGQTVVVSGAAGATGSVAAQIAKLSGCRVIGIAGGPRKCSWLRDDVGLDGVIDYRNEPVPERLQALCPDGIDVYFDNVGGPILDAVLLNLALRARVVICGAISGYNDRRGERYGLKAHGMLILKRARMEGFIIFDYADRFAEGIAALADWVRSGQLLYQEDIQQGFENAPATFLRLFERKNLGKQLLAL